MSTLVSSSRAAHHAGLDEPISTPTTSNTLPPPSTALKWQSLPPLLSRLPPALLASPESVPIPITPLKADFTNDGITESKFEVGYTESHLPAIDTASLALHYALYKFRVLDLEHYATAPYEQAFNWKEIQLPLELEREW